MADSVTTVAPGTPRARRRPRRRVIAAGVAAALVAAAAVVLVLVLTGGGGNGGSGGPLTNHEHTGFAFAVTPGRPFAYGIPTVYNASSKPLTVQRVSLRGATAGLRLRRAYLGGPRRRDGFVANSATPQPLRQYRHQDLHPLPATLAPKATAGGRRGGELVLVMQVPRTGRFTFSGLDVHYRDNKGGRWTRVVDDTLAACGSTNPQANCDHPPGF